jgi:hypothetical protein
MNSRELYKRFLLKNNKNDSNEGVNILPSLFVLMFNTEAKRWLGQKLNEDSDNIRLDHLDILLKSDVKLKEVNKGSDWIEFELPDGFYRHSSSFALVNKDNCSGVKIFYFEKKPLGFVATLADDFSKANFDYQEAPFIITEKKIKAYIDGYEIKDFLTSYYRVPKDIDIAGYEKIDGTPSKDIDCELEDESIDEILNRLTLEASREFKDVEGFQFSKERVQTEP